MFSLKSIRANIASLIAPGVFPSAGSEPRQIQIVSAPVAPAPSASARTASVPMSRRAPVGENGLTAYQEKVRFEARLKAEFGLHEKLATAGMKSDARRKVLAEFDRYVARSPLAKAAPPSGTVDDEGNIPVKTESDATLDSILTMLQKALSDLKAYAGDIVDSTDETEAKAALRAGNKPEALRKFDAAICKIGSRVNAKSALRNQKPDGHKRSHALISGGFNEQPAVAALNAALGRGQASLSLGQRSALALAPVAGRIVPAPAAVTTTASERPDPVKINSIRAELKAIDREQRKQFSNERNARHGELSRQLRAEMNKFHVR